MPPLTWRAKRDAHVLFRRYVTRADADTAWQRWDADGFEDALLAVVQPSLPLLFDAWQAQWVRLLRVWARAAQPPVQHARARRRARPRVRDVVDAVTSARIEERLGGLIVCAWRIMSTHGGAVLHTVPALKAAVYEAWCDSMVRILASLRPLRLSDVLPPLHWLRYHGERARVTLLACCVLEDTLDVPRDVQAYAHYADVLPLVAACVRTDVRSLHFTQGDRVGAYTMRVCRRAGNLQRRGPALLAWARWWRR